MGAFRARLRVRSLSGGNSPRGFFVYPSAWFCCANHARQRPGPGPNTYTARSHKRGSDSYSHFDVRVSKIIPYFGRAFAMLGRAVAGVGAVGTGVVGHGVNGFFCCLCSVRLTGSSGWFGARTASQNLRFVFGLFFWVCFVLTRDGPVLPLERCDSAPRGRQGKSFFWCACAVSRPVSGALR